MKNNSQYSYLLVGRYKVPGEPPFHVITQAFTEQEIKEAIQKFSKSVGKSRFSELIVLAPGAECH